MAAVIRREAKIINGFSPLHEGDTSVAAGKRVEAAHDLDVSVPFTRGTPPWRWRNPARYLGMSGFSPLHEGDTSVAKFTTLWTVRDSTFQSPSRGGHLRGAARKDSRP